MKSIFVLVLISFSYSHCALAEEYVFEKNCNPEILLEELQTAGIDLEGKDQVGSLNTSENKITIIAKEDIDVTKLKEVISAHQYKHPAQVERERFKEERRKKEANRAAAKAKLKTGQPLTDDEINALFE